MTYTSLFTPILFALGSIAPLTGFAAEKYRCEEEVLPPHVRLEQLQEKRFKSSSTDRKTKSISATINGKKTEVKYKRYGARNTPSLGVIINLCGGPGYSCTEAGRSQQFPEDYDVITLDYMGIGDNRRVNSPESMSIDSQGEAVAAITRSLGNENVVIYGHSFGTSVATAAASKLTANGNPPSNLKAVMIEGVVGKPGLSPYGSGHVKTAEFTWKKLGAFGQKKFTESYKRATKSFNALQKREFDEMINSTLGDGPEPTLELLRNIDAAAKEMKSGRSKRNRQFEPNRRDSDGDNQYKAAGCQITGPSGHAKPQKIFGGLVEMTFAQEPGDPDICSCRTVPRDYNPADYPIKNLNLVYMNGEYDPITPVDWAKSHYDSQTATDKKVFLTLTEGGHSESLGIGPVANCNDEIYSALFSGNISGLERQKKRLEDGRCGTEEEMSYEGFQ